MLTCFILYKQISIKYCKNYLFQVENIQFCLIDLLFFWGKGIYLNNRGKCKLFGSVIVPYFWPQKT